MSNLHVIIGEDDFLVSETAKKFLAGVDRQAVETIDSAGDGNAELQLKSLRAADLSFSTPPFLDPVKATWWKNVGFLPQGGKKSSAEEVKTALEKFAKKLVACALPENQIFILSGRALLRTSVFAKTLLSAGVEIVDFSPGKPWEQARIAAQRACEFAAEAGLNFEPGAAEAFVARVGCDSRSLMSEIGKMRDYLGGGAKTITRKAVDEISSAGVGVEPEVWSITDALGARDVAKLVAAVAKFERENGFAVLVTTVVEKFLRQLVELKDAQAQGAEAFEAATEGMNAFVKRKNLEFLSNWKLNELRAARFRFLKLRERAVTTSGAADVLVTTELVRAAARPAARRK